MKKPWTVFVLIFLLVCPLSLRAEAEEKEAPKPTVTGMSEEEAYSQLNEGHKPKYFLKGLSDKEIAERINEGEIPKDVIYSDEIVLTATRSVQFVNRVTDNVTILTERDMERMPARDLDELIGMVPGVVVQDNGNIGQAVTTTILGSRFRRVRVLVDGIPFNTTTEGNVDLAQFSLENVAKIEIIKGPSSSVWGSSLGGVINIITRPTGDEIVPHGSIGAAAAEFGTQREHFSFAQKLGDFSYFTSGSFVDTGGFRPHSEVTEKRGFLKGEWKITDYLEGKAAFGYLNADREEFEQPIDMVFSDFVFHTKYGYAGFDLDVFDNFETEWLFKFSDRHFFRDTYLLTAIGAVRANELWRNDDGDSIRGEASFKGTYFPAERHKMIFGSDVGYDILRARRFQRSLATRNFATAFNVNQSNTKKAFYLNYQYSPMDFSFVGGARVDDSSMFGSFVSLSFGSVMPVPKLPQTFFRFNVQRAFNEPALIDLFLSSGTLVANPGLKPEKSVAYNFGIESNPYSWLWLKGTFFQEFLKDAIEVRTVAPNQRQSVNIERERRDGFDGEIKIEPLSGLELSYGVAVVEPTDRVGTTIIRNRPRLTHDVGLNYYRVLFWGFAVNFNTHGRWILTNETPDATPPYDNRFVFDAKLRFDLPKILYGNASIYVQASNIFNEDFSFDHRRFPIPERNFEAGITYKF